MIDKRDWEAAYRDLVAERRQRLKVRSGEREPAAAFPDEPSAEDIAEEHEILATYPELARALAEPLEVPYEGKPGDADFLSAEEVSHDWATLQERLEARERRRESAPLAARLTRPAGRQLRSWRLASLAAAALAVVFAGLYWRAQSDLKRLASELREPRVRLEQRLLLPDGQRGGVEQPPIPLPAEAEYFLLVPALVNHPRYPDYRLTIFDLGSERPRRLWSDAGLERRSDDTFEILVPRAFLDPGTYRLVLAGIDEAGEHPLASYTVRLAPE